MKKMIDKIINLLLPIYLIVNILYLLIGNFLFSIIEKISMKKFSYGYIVLLIINIIISMIIFITKNYKKNKIDIFLILITIFSFISYLFAYNKQVALYGTYYRYEGLFLILYYMTIIFISSYVKQEYKKNIIYVILMSGFIEFVFAFYQKLDLFGLGNLYKYAQGFTTNPNFFATLMLLCLGLSIGLFFDNQDNELSKNIIYLILSCLYMLGLLFANTTSCMVGLIFVLIYLFIYSKKNKDYKKFITIICFIISTTIIINILGLSNQIKDLIIAIGQGANVAVGNARPEYGTARIYIWKKTLEAVPKYWLHGVGIDNFKYINNGKSIPYWVVIDKCHNEYLQILITTGIFSLISYLGLYYNIVKDGIKNCFKGKEIYLLLPVLGYLIQAFFNISVIEVAPLFYIILGLLGGQV